MQDTAELNQASFPLLTRNLGTVDIGKTFGDPGKQQASQLSIRDAAHHLFPERHSQIGVILSQPLVGLDAGLIAVSGTTPCSVLGLALHQSGRQESRQPIAHRCAGHCKLSGHFGHRQRAAPADEIQQFAIR